MTKTIALLVTLDTKFQEADYLIERIEKRGQKALLMDIGVIGDPGTPASITREEIAEAGGSSLQGLLKKPTREEAGPVMVQGSINILLKKIGADEVHAVLGLGGTQGTSSCCDIMQALPYGLPKIHKLEWPLPDPLTEKPPMRPINSLLFWGKWARW